MLSVVLIAVGRLRDKYYEQACAEYVKRLGGVRFSLVETAPAKLPDDPSEKQIAAALDKEADEILSKIPSGAFVAPLCVEGESLSSAQLSGMMTKAAVSGRSCVCFIIGSSFGLSDRVKQRGDVRLSMSRMTFPHTLARVMLLEQIYRAVSIARGGKYDK